MNEGDVSGVDKSDDGVVDVRRERHCVDIPEFLCRVEQQVGEMAVRPFQLQLILRDVYPHGSVDFTAGIAEHLDLRHVDTVVRECRYLPARASGIELPPVVTTRDRITIIPSF